MKIQFTYIQKKLKILWAQINNNHYFWNLRILTSESSKPLMNVLCGIQRSAMENKRIYIFYEFDLGFIFRLSLFIGKWIINKRSRQAAKGNNLKINFKKLKILLIIWKWRWFIDNSSITYSNRWGSICFLMPKYFKKLSAFSMSKCENFVQWKWNFPIKKRVGNKNLFFNFMIKCFYCLFNKINQNPTKKA